MTTIDARQQADESGWTARDAADLYRIGGWGTGYFAINTTGNIAALPAKDASRAIDLHEVVTGLRDRGICPPVLLRFDDLLTHRLGHMRDAFDKAIASNGYQGDYRCVYPIKANQQRHICELIRDLGADLGFGLEAGSKPELLAVLALTAGHDDMPIICNGFKDEEFIETVVLAAKLGRNVTPIVENFAELGLIIKHAKHYGVRPSIGVRIKLAAQGIGRWEASGGVRSKFGLFVAEVIEAVECLRREGMEDCLRLVHCHIGSQVGDIRRIKGAIDELAHFYAELKRLGTGVTTIDIGGGLGVDYDGSQSGHDSSINYTIEEYAEDVIYRIRNVCDEADVPHANIISESGRATVAYSSVLVVDVLGASRFDLGPDPASMQELRSQQGTPQPVLDLLEAYQRLDGANLLEVYHDLIHARGEAMSLFNLGYLSLPLRASAERLFWATARRVLELAEASGDPLPEELESLPALLSDIYFCNFSVFQSLPDSWAIDQLFPVCPIHRLNERPDRRAVLADITCDSDGQLDRFVGDARTLPLHALREGEPYHLGIFLIGAYQETLGDLHNLFGDTHAVHVTLDADGNWQIDEVVEGDTVSEVLSYVQYDTTAMKRTMRQDIERAVRSGRLDVSEGRSLRSFYETGLDGITYLEE